MKKNFKLILKIEISPRDKQFIVSDNLFCDYGVGGSLEECFDDYVQTLIERGRIMDDSKHEKRTKELNKYLKISRS